jgi:uncharacterized metal-binding protein YceD (DUF177 family)
MRTKTDVNQPEFSRTIVIEKIPTAGVEQQLVAKDDERKKLAERLGLVELPKLEAKVTVHPVRADQTITVTGTLKADVVQQCVVTLEPLTNQIEYDFKVLYAAPELLTEGAGPSDMEEEDMEPILDGTIDLGELVAQNLGIALDPYPRKPGVGFVEAAYGDAKAAPGPLAQLVNLPKKPKDSR